MIRGYVSPGGGAVGVYGDWGWWNWARDLAYNVGSSPPVAGLGSWYNRNVKGWWGNLPAWSKAGFIGMGLTNLMFMGSWATQTFGGNLAMKNTIDYGWESSKRRLDYEQSLWRERQVWYQFKDSAGLSGVGYVGGSVSDPYYDQKSKMYYHLSSGGLPYGSGGRFGGYPEFSRFPAADFGGAGAGI